VYFINVSFVGCLDCYDLRSIPFGSPANLFLSGKAEKAVETRQLFFFAHHDLRCLAVESCDLHGCPDSG
jgi:hypothetical protein